MFYAKYNDNCHIVNDLKSLPLKDLKIMDNVILLGGKDVICTSNYLLQNKKFDDAIYEFKVNPDEISYLEANRMSTSSGWNYTLHGNERICAYNNNGELITLCNLNNRAQELGNHSLTNLTKDLSKHYNDKLNGTVYSNSFKLNKDSNEENWDNICSYITIPLNETHFMVLVQVFCISIEKRRTSLFEYICFCPYTSKRAEIIKDKKMLDFYYVMECEIFATRGLSKIFEQIKPNLKEDKYTKAFEDACFAGNYKLDDYLKDTNKEKNIQRASAFLSKILKTKVDLEQYYSPVFKIEKFASHYFDDILVTYKGEIMHCGSGYDFRDEHFYQHGLEYFYKAPDVMKDNEKNQTLYKIAYNVAEFNKNKDDIDPITGDYYHYGTLNNEDIIYKDNEGIIVRGRSKKYYAKKYGYFLEVYRDEAKEIEERMLLTNKLSEKE